MQFKLNSAHLFYLISVCAIGQPSAIAKDIFIAQNTTGAGSGQDCGNAHPYTFFNSSANWGSGATQIGPGTTVHLCGTFTGTAGGTMLKAQGSGTSTSYITLFGEPGAKFLAPYWSGDTSSGGAINTNGQSYITIDGGVTCGWSPTTLAVTPCNMSIANTQNGTGLAYDAASVAILVPSGSNYVEIKNTDCHDIYRHATGGTDDETNYVSQSCVFMGYTGAGANHITIDHNVFHDGGWLINAGVDYITIGPGNEFYNADHDISSAPIHGYIFGNHFHDWSNWSGFGAHHDGYHCFAGSSAGASQVLYIYNNQFDGDPGALGLTGFVFLETGDAGTGCFARGAEGVYLFNNVAVLGNNTGANFWLQGGGASFVMANAFVANNTVIGNQPSSTTSAGSFVYRYTNNATFTNNAVGGLSILLGQQTAVTWASGPDYNYYENCISGGPCFAAEGQSTNSYPSWRDAGFDVHGGANLSSTTYFGLSSGCVPLSVGAECAPVSGSPLIGGGKNLYSLCNGQPNPGLGALCSDIKGTARPAAGPWDAGAYQAYISGGAPPDPPTGLSSIAK